MSFNLKNPRLSTERLAMTELERKRHVVEDEFFDYYMCWCDASIDVVDAYARWQSAEAADRVLAHSAYLAALDREAAAAETYEQLAIEIAELDVVPVIALPLRSLLAS